MATAPSRGLGDKIRRGQRGRVEAGKMPGGLCYGYAVVRELDAKGEPVRGGRVVDPVQADVVLRIYREFLGGRSPRAIAHRLNAEGIPSARGGEWRASAIVGSRARQIGILHNPIYSGRFIFNRVKMVRDPTPTSPTHTADASKIWGRPSWPAAKAVSTPCLRSVR